VALKPPPIIPVAPVAAQGAAVNSGAAAAGIGSGAGGQGNGTGAGGSGDGDGDGPELVSGSIKTSDTPANLFHAPFAGTTSALVQIDAKGKITDCRTQASSGNATLDTLTCHLIATRFRFRPARDSAGRATPGTIFYDQDWQITGDFEP
jgi:protein TonB